MLQIGVASKMRGHEYGVVVPEGRHNPRTKEKNYIWLGNRFAEDSHIILGRLTGLGGLFSWFSTRRLIDELKKIKPDVIHLHNLHNCYINLPLLFGYLKSSGVKTVWTLHDCWAFTGKCPHYLMANCDRWKTGCHHCSQLSSYPVSWIDSTSVMWKLKKHWFNGVDNMTVVTPSRWMSEQLKASFLKDYPVRIINNGIDLSVFTPVHGDFRERYKISRDEFVVLGVAFGWGVRKGLDVFVELSKRLGKGFRIVLVGTDDKIDRQLPENIISIHRTESQSELAGIYSAADVFVNPTREDNYPTVNMEALSCGTPVITFDTGGSAEIINESCGASVDCGNIDSLEQEILSTQRLNQYTRQACTEHAKSFDKNRIFCEYVNLYEELYGKPSN